MYQICLACRKYYAAVLGLCLVLFSGISCNKQKTIENNAFLKVIEHTVADLEEWMACHRELTDEERLLTSGMDLLNALKNKDITTAQEHSTMHGLGSLLYIDIANIERYKITNHQITHNKANITCTINDLEYPVQFLFGRAADNNWRFEGINTYRLHNLKNIPSYFRDRLPF